MCTPVHTKMEVCSPLPNAPLLYHGCCCQAPSIGHHLHISYINKPVNRPASPLRATLTMASLPLALRSILSNPSDRQIQQRQSPWHSTATGHQIADSSGSRRSVERKLRTERVNAQARGAVEKKRADGSGRGRRKGGQRDIRAFMSGVSKGICFDGREKGKGDDDYDNYDDNDDDRCGAYTSTDDNINKPHQLRHPQSQPPPLQLKPHPQPPHPQIFHSLTIYINGSTGPLISDHALRTLLATHGARLALAHTAAVTHVILAPPAPTTSSPSYSSFYSSSSSSSPQQQTPHAPHGRVRHGCGGGLAARKRQAELQARLGHGRVPAWFVTAAWAVESVAAGRRLAEGRFAVWLGGT